MMLSVGIASAATGSYNFPANEGGGSLTWTITTTGGTCGPNGEYNYTEWSDSGFTYINSSGTQYPLIGGGSYIQSSSSTYCPATGGYPALLPMGTAAFMVYFTPEVNGSGTATYYPTAIVDPQYHVISIIYDPPGNVSSNGYTNSTTNGTTTSIGSSFTAGDEVTYSAGGPFGGASFSFGTTATTGNSYAFTETIADATGISIANSGSSGSSPNALNHLEDTFVIWLNPQVSVMSTSSTTGSYEVGTTNSSGQLDIVEVTADAMVNNNVPVGVLVPQSNGPGLAYICFNQAQYALGCPYGTPCGCTKGDWQLILDEDPLLNYSSTQSVYGADTSGTLCENPTSTDSCRYVPVLEGGEQVNTYLSGPDCAPPSCPYVINSFTQTDAHTTTQTFSESWSESMGYTTTAGFPAWGLTVSNENTWTWTNSESAGEINGTANSMIVSLESLTVGCYEQGIQIFEDTVFHTLVYQQPTGNTSCP